MTRPALGRRRGTRGNERSRQKAKLVVGFIVTFVGATLVLTMTTSHAFFETKNEQHALQSVNKVVESETKLRGAGQEHHIGFNAIKAKLQQAQHLRLGKHKANKQAAVVANDKKKATDKKDYGDAYYDDDVEEEEGDDDDVELPEAQDDDVLLNEANQQHEEHHEPPKLKQDEVKKAEIKQVSDTPPTKPFPYLGNKASPTMSFKDWKPPGGHRFEEYKEGGTPYIVTDEMKLKSDELAKTRRVHVRNAMKHAWDGYTEHAFGKDEVGPTSGLGSNGWGGMGTTLVDALDTLWLMNLKDEFYKARDWVRDELTHDHAGRSVSVFETTIRSLGGLLSAYDWSQDEAFLTKALDLGQRLFKAFDVPSGIPNGQVNLGTGTSGNVAWTGSNAILAEFGTLQIEFRYLAKATNTTEFATKSERVFEIMNKQSPPNGLFPYYIRNRGSTPEFSNNKLTFGAMADSFYEYMLKVWLQGGKTEPMYRTMYDKAMQGMHDVLLQTSTPSGLTYIADKNGGHTDHKMDHLVCFMGGLLALGAYTDPQGLESPRAQRDLKTGKALAYTCYQMYARMATGISPEWVAFHKGSDFEVGHGSPHYLLRPEAVESLFILNQLTGDPIYREWGWEIFSAIERYCKTDIAYGELKDVRDPEVKPRDKMESFFLAETLKYLYLLQDPDTPVDILHKHVFNTEAHPTRIFPEIDKVTAQK